MSLGSFMNTDFSNMSPRGNKNNLSDLFQSFDAYNMAQGKMPHGRAQVPGDILTEMAQKMFASVMGQFQQGSNNQQGFNMNNKPSRRF